MPFPRLSMRGTGGERSVFDGEHSFWDFISLGNFCKAGRKWSTLQDLRERAKRDRGTPFTDSNIFTPKLKMVVAGKP